MVKEVLDTMVALANEGMTMVSLPMKWDSRARWPTASYSWTEALLSKRPHRLISSRDPGRIAPACFLSQLLH